MFERFLKLVSRKFTLSQYLLMLQYKMTYTVIEYFIRITQHFIMWSRMSVTFCVAAVLRQHKHAMRLR